MPVASVLITPVPVPAESAVHGVYGTPHLADAFAVTLPETACTDPETLARFIFSQQPAWIGALLKVRDALVAGFGLKTARHLQSLGGRDPVGRIGIFKVYSADASEVVLGEDDRHLDFRASVLCTGQPGARRLVLSTVVHCHNLLGHVYLGVISPFHRRVVQASLRHAARRGWPSR